MARIYGSTVAIVGGSVAGCAAAIALTRLGCDVQVFERSSGILRDRGAGIIVPPSLRNELIGRGYLPVGFPTCQFARRLWIVADGTTSGRVLWRQPGAVAANNWGVLWRSLRAGVPDERYRDGTTVTAFNAGPQGMQATFVDGTSRMFDVLVGADGYRSLVHSRLSEQTRLLYAGYVAWRGTYPEERLDHRALLDLGDAEAAWFFLCYAAGHAIVYVVPGFDGRTDPGHRQVNWLVYAPPPSEMDFTTPTSVPPGTVSADLHHAFDNMLTEAFPPDVQAVYRTSSRAEVSIQPIYDRRVDSYVSNRVLVIGDAGAVARPHTGSGTTKALQDALRLERLGSEHSNWDDLLAAYDAERSAAGNALVDLGRRIGRDQVESTPQWATLTPRDFDAWTKETLAGQQHYFYGSVDVG